MNAYIRAHFDRLNAISFVHELKENLTMIYHNDLLRSYAQSCRVWMREKMEPNDLKFVTKAIYRKRRKTHPPLPKSKQETHKALSKMNIKTNKFENFLQVNDDQNEIIILTCSANLECICNVSNIFMDGTYKYCTKFYEQLDSFMATKMGIIYR